LPRQEPKVRIHLPPAKSRANASTDVEVTRDRDEAAAALEREAIGREPIPTRMSFRVEFNRISGNAPPAGTERPTGYGTPAEVAADLPRYREAAGLEAFQINFHGNRNLGQLLQSMEWFMREVKRRLA